MRKAVIAGNWKMFKTQGEARAFMDVLVPKVAGVTHCEIIVAPPFTALRTVVSAAQGTRIAVAAQNLHWEKEGPFTGEISAGMILDLGCQAVIVGHSERRQYFGETDNTVKQKVKAALIAGLTPIVCIGETLPEREAGEMEAVLKRQITRGLAALTVEEFSRILIAYEPVWAIGTGQTATPAIAASAHRFIRQQASEQFTAESAVQLRILYGGSVKPENISALMAEDDIDGALVGGASLDAQSFASIVKYPM
jgi:triosephosphate isomerase